MIDEILRILFLIVFAVVSLFVFAMFIVCVLAATGLLFVIQDAVDEWRWGRRRY